MAANPGSVKIIKDGLWTNNSALVQVLGLCPLLAVSNSVVNALGLGIATILVLTGSNTTVSLIRRYASNEIRLPVFVMIIASFTTCVELLMQAFTYDLYNVLGIFIPLIVTNCIVLGRADAFASKNRVGPAMLDGFMMGLGFCLVLMALGAIRELLGQGTLFSNMHFLLGDIAKDWTLSISDAYIPFLFALLPPGAFVAMGFLMALKNRIDTHLKQRALAKQDDAPRESRRVRTTGAIN